ncbi:metal ABC transporter ATP-binding protein [bacterium]|nr:metal ABC transporter ATP-binding protein [bacterium]
MNPVLKITNLSVRYQSSPVLWKINVDITRGKIIGVIGPNGSGKSTLLKACLNLVPRITGDVRFFGNKSFEETRKQIAYLPQRESIDWDFPVRVLDVVLMGAYSRLGLFRNPGATEKTFAMECLDRVGLKDFSKRHISELSGGQQQRVFLARALMTKAELYFLDEPFSAVDVVTESMILSVLKQLRDDGKTLLISHHDLNSVRESTDEVILINKEILSFGATSEVMSNLNLQKAYGKSFT